MSNLKFIAIVNLIVQVVFISCVAAAAIYFNRPTLLWWWLLAPLFCLTYSSTRDGALNVCPACFDANYRGESPNECSDLLRDCLDCRKEYWLEEVE